MVGAVRFELTTSWTRTTRASQATLRPEPTESSIQCRSAGLFATAKLRTYTVYVD